MNNNVTQTASGGRGYGTTRIAGAPGAARERGGQARPREGAGEVLGCLQRQRGRRGDFAKNHREEEERKRAPIDELCRWLCASRRREAAGVWCAPCRRGGARFRAGKTPCT